MMKINKKHQEDWLSYCKEANYDREKLMFKVNKYESYSDLKVWCEKRI